MPVVVEPNERRDATKYHFGQLRPDMEETSFILLGDHSISGANRLLVIKVPSHFSS